MTLIGQICVAVALLALTVTIAVMIHRDAQQRANARASRRTSRRITDYTE